MRLHLAYLNIRKLVSVLLGVLFSMSLSAQVDWTGEVKVTPNSLQLVDDITMYNLSYGVHATVGGPASMDGNGGYEIKNDLIEYINGGDWLEYQIISPESGQFALTVPVSSKRTNSNVNVSVYPVGSAFEMNGTTTSTYNGQWQSPVGYIFPFELEAGIVYDMRVTFVEGGCNIFNDGLIIEKLEGPIDATLKDITIGGVTIPGFSSDVFEYTIALEPDEWISNLSAEANDATATVEVPEISKPDLSPGEGTKATASIKCTSQSGISLTYTINIIMPTEIFDGVSLGLTDDDIYMNNGISMRRSKINNTGNNEYVEYYIYAAFDDNYAITLECTNGYLDSESYLNVSTLAMDDSTWALDERNTRLVPVTYNTDDPTVGEWNNTLCTPNNITYTIQLKEYEPVRLRIYVISNKNNAADISSISFDAITGNIDNTLSNLTVNGISVPDFDPAVTNYTLLLPVGSTSAEIGATANDASAQGIVGTGSIDITDNKTTAEIVVTSEAGYPMTYKVNMMSPMPIVAGDTLALGDDLYYSNGARATNAQINWFADSTYVEYYIYSETDADMHLIMLAANGNDETVYSKVNVATYSLGSEWISDGSITKDIEQADSNMWTVDYALEKEYNISLVANEATILRITSFTNSSFSAANIYKLTFGEGHTTAGGENDTIPGDEDNTDTIPDGEEGTDTIPDIEDDTSIAWTGEAKIVPDSLLLVDDITAYYLSYEGHATTGGPSSFDSNRNLEVKNDLIEYISDGDWLEYQIISPESGMFAVTVPVSSKRTNSNVNVSVYPMDSTFVMNGITTSTFNNQWQSPVDYVFPFELEAGIVYNMRVTFVEGGCNIFNDGFKVDELIGPSDPSLKDITIGGATIPGFSPNVFEYTIALDPDEWVNALAAEANDATATIEIPEITQPNPSAGEGVNASAEIKCTSQSGISQTYSVNIIIPTEITNESSLGFTDADVFINNGVIMDETKISHISNAEYVEYYIYSSSNDSIELTIECTNGFVDSESFLNISTLAMDENNWTLDNRTTQKVPVTYNSENPTSGEWNSSLCIPNNLSFAIKLYENVPVRLRIYAISNRINCIDISGITFNVLPKSNDNTLSDLTLNGTSIPDFVPANTSYTLTLAAGTSQVEIGATPNDSKVRDIDGTGTIDIIGQSTTAEVIVTSEAGIPLTYSVTFIAPKAIKDGDTLALGDDSYTNSGDGVRVSNAQINWFADSMYVEYFIYSETDADMHLTMLASNGNNDTVYSKVNISTYTPGNEWTSDGSITKDIMRMEVDGWTKDFALEEEYNISLVANEATILRLTSFTNAPINVANIFKLTFGDGHTTAGGEDDGTASIDEIAATNISVITSKGSLAVIGDETMLNASVKIFDISGCLVVNQVAQSSHESYDINQSGIYIVRVVSPDNAISTIKCMVR